MENLKVGWTSPSNIALVKYWGKVPVQIPANPSISFTLSESKTSMTVFVSPSNKKEVDVDFYFEGELNEKFKTKIVKFLETEVERFPWLEEFHLAINSENTFPHSSGIASSASSMSALTLCLLSLDEKITGHTLLLEDFFREASDLSRKASGSASRSIYPILATWGEIDDLPETSNLFASPIKKTEIHESFRKFCDAILIVDAGEKSVSSRAGHALMDNHPFAIERFKRARHNLTRLLAAMRAGDMNTFIEVVEEEALMLHSLMMTSTPSYILLKPTSLLLIEKIREFRAKTNIPVCFTIDAGPNIHLLYPAEFRTDVHQWLKSELVDLKVVQNIIYDEVGMGPERIKD
ncbi:MAG: diphosphomevalonate decarboxylase [Bacteriovorax sp.]|nr:diphosphomevalonate decarboxylase [Bacteriovorax sp.]